MPEMFGTHHSKMLILFRHDDMAQVIIHTANMIPRDWANMAQGMWRSPLLPLTHTQGGEDEEQGESKTRMGDGVKFKKDLLNYLREYDRRTLCCRNLVERLEKYDFSAIRAVLIASVPGRHMRHDDSTTRWGWAALAVALGFLTVKGEKKAEVVIQISSIATLGPKDTWLRQTLFKALGSSARNPSMQTCDFKVVFPTPDEIRRSLDGYNAGASVHTKIQSPQQQKQLEYLTPILHHWADDAPKGAS
ncbi:MAG: tyrosyl-DNA phosphodiesterase 1 [Thaumarchaeota archaeon]|nr:tyrosyl-DNA phosphodiesterase 1 [Nitrososphaerota archaeon]